MALQNVPNSFLATPVSNDNAITYSIGSTGIAIAASATDVFTISGSATKLVKVLYVEIMGIKTLAGQEIVTLVKRSSANTGGTILTGTGVPHDSLFPAQTATLNFYTANPTSLGALVNFIRTDRVFWPATASVTAPSIIIWDFREGAPLILRGTSELLAVNMQGGSIAGDTIFINTTWTEE